MEKEQELDITKKKEGFRGILKPNKKQGNRLHPDEVHRRQLERTKAMEAWYDDMQLMDFKVKF